MENNKPQHLDEVEQTYWQHLVHSFKQSNALIIIALKSYVHGVFPMFFAGDGPIGIYKIYKEIRRMHHVLRLFKEYDAEQKDRK
jgi:hypothetical protein